MPDFEMKRATLLYITCLILFYSKYLLIFTLLLLPSSGARYCDERACLCCLSLNLLLYGSISQKPDVQTSPQHRHVLTPLLRGIVASCPIHMLPPGESFESQAP